MVIEMNNVEYNPMFSKTLETKKPADIKPKEKEAAIIPIIPSLYPFNFVRITITVKKYPSPIPVNKAKIDKYLILGEILLKST